MAKYVPDFICLAGLSMLGAGLWLYRPWVALTVCGALLIAAGLRAGR